MKWNPRDLPEERPSSFDERGKKLSLYPSAVKGKYRDRRNIVFSILIFIFLVLPWTQFGGEQTILLNLVEKKFVFFGKVFWAHDGPFIFFPLILTTLVLCLITSLWGRLWCGWGCPQTVFIDFLFRRVEMWIEGSHLKRRKLDESSWTVNKVSKKFLKWSVFFIMSSHIAHSFTAYFVGAKGLVWITVGSPMEHWWLFAFVQILTLILLFDFGWFREQFCIIMCPYGRFQSVLMGRHSLSVVYDEKRGEPRRGVSTDGQGDCVDCYRCVQVCPTGIDIRRGVQLECIACTACIDVCDEVMDKVKKPSGLIRYASVSELDHNKRNFFTRRNITYMAVISALCLVFALLVFHRDDLHLQVVRAIETPYTVVGNEVINHFRLNVTNQAQEEVELKSPSVEGGEVVSPQFPVLLKSGERKKIHFFVKISKEKIKNYGRLRRQVKFEFEKGQTLNSIVKGLTLLGPVRP